MKKWAGNKKIRMVLIVIFWLVCWQFLALYLNSSILLAGPLEVFADLKNNIVTIHFWKTVCNSFLHILSGFFAAFVVASFLGIVAAKYSFLEEFFAPLMQFIKAVPVASFVVLLLIWAGSEKLSVFVTFLMVLPIMFQNVLGGIKNTDKELLEMAKVFGMPFANKIRYIYIPSLMPFLLSGCKAALGMSWKAGVAAEVIGTPDFSIGERIYMSKIYLNTAGLFSWTLVVIVLSILFEKAFLFLLQKAAVAGKRPVRIKKGRDFDKDRKWRKGENTDKGIHGKETQDICLENIYKKYGEQQVYSDFTIQFLEGGIYCLMARSGGGKTTLFRMLLGLEECQKGRIQVPKRHGAAVFQEDRLCLEEDALTNVSMVCNKEISNETIQNILAEVLPKEELEKKVGEFSGGMKRRVAIVRAFLSDAGWLIMDEPFTGLDEKTKERMIRFILKYRKGRTLLLATHQESDAEALGAKQIILR